MKPRTRLRGFLLPHNACPAAARSLARPQRRNATTSTSSTSSPTSQIRWLRLTVVTVTAAGIGAYIKWLQDSGSSTTLNPARFTPYTLVSRETVSSTGSLFTIKPPKSDGSNFEVYDAAWKTGVWSVMFKQPQLQIGRDYTPLPSTDPDGDDECLRFFIRKDPFGEVSRYLHSLKIGAPIEVRGPRIECEIPSNTKTILFIAGGTGIAPALQAGHTLLRRTDQTNKPKIHILWANRRREDCKGGRNEITDSEVETQTSWLSRLFKPSKSAVTPGPSDVRDIMDGSLIVQELEALKAQYPEQVTVQYFVDDENKFIGKKSISDLTEAASPSPGTQSGNLIFVSGPEGFISYMAGPKLWAQGMELQGPLRGIIKELDLKDWAVWKL
ncbi:cytochrome b5 reductase family protein [Aspergillus undulatus]|uniref:cytochrome b5 reductase family protein n=1 Tax=Aspergillus undulatus TaxID=1810928 RepID=UPI003CCE1FCD